MAAVETKVPGYFTERMKVEDDDKDGFGTRNLVLKVRLLASRPPRAHAADVRGVCAVRSRRSSHTLLARRA